MATQLFQLERNGILEGNTYANATGPCHEWMKDQKHCKVAVLKVEGDVDHYLTLGECREIARRLVQQR
jgi:hypothetical protein